MNESTDFDFERWAGLAKQDPEAFERLRAETIEALMASAPEAVRRRLVGLQWRIDCVRDRAGTPLAACLRISQMMWDTVTGAHGLLENLNTLSDAATGGRAERPCATVLAFRHLGSGDGATHTPHED